WLYRWRYGRGRGRRGKRRRKGRRARAQRIRADNSRSGGAAGPPLPVSHTQTKPRLPPVVPPVPLPPPRTIGSVQVVSRVGGVVRTVSLAVHSRPNRSVGSSPPTAPTLMFAPSAGSPAPISGLPALGV